MTNGMVESGGAASGTAVGVNHCAEVGFVDGATDQFPEGPAKLFRQCNDKCVANGPTDNCFFLDGVAKELTNSLAQVEVKWIVQSPFPRRLLCDG